MLLLVPRVTIVLSMYKPSKTAMRFRVTAVRCAFEVVEQQG